MILHQFEADVSITPMMNTPTTVRGVSATTNTFTFTKIRFPRIYLKSDFSINHSLSSLLCREKKRKGELTEIPLLIKKCKKKKNDPRFFLKYRFERNFFIPCSHRDFVKFQIARDGSNFVNRICAPLVMCLNSYHD